MAPERTCQVDDLCRRLGVASLYAFGSRSGETREWLEGRRACMGDSTSDLDLAVQPVERTWAVVRKADASTALEGFFGVPRVDLVLLSEASAFLAVEMINWELLFCDDPVRHAEEELFEICSAQFDDVEGVPDAFLAWLPAHPDRLEGTLD